MAIIITNDEPPPTREPPRPASGVLIAGQATILFFDSYRNGRRSKTQLRIGRQGDCEIRISSDYAISREHAVLQRVDNEARILLDHGSKNGVYVDWERVTEGIVLTVGMRIHVGQTMLIAVDEKGDFPICARNMTSLAKKASELYGNHALAAEHVGRSKEFVRQRAHKTKRSSTTKRGKRRQRRK